MWTILKVFIEFVTILLLFYVLVFGHEACGILAPRPGIEPTTPELEGKVSTTGPPGKSHRPFLDSTTHSSCHVLSNYSGTRSFNIQTSLIPQTFQWGRHCCPSSKDSKVNGGSESLDAESGSLHSSCQLEPLTVPSPSTLSPCAFPHVTITSILQRLLKCQLCCEASPGDSKLIDVFSSFVNPHIIYYINLP